MKKYHPLANVFPLMKGAEYEALKRDIAENGLLEKIRLHRDGSIVDGRNRYRACIDVGVEPEFTTWDGDDSELLGYILSLNLHRRHLNSGQLAIVALEVEKELAKLAKKRQAHGKTAPGKRFSSEIEKRSEPTHAAKQAAAMVGTNNSYVSQAKKLAAEAPDLLDEVREGNLSLPKATRQMKQKQRRAERVARIQELSAGSEPLQAKQVRYPVIYADPPWRYEHAKTESRAIENHYPTMSLKDICDLPVSDLATDDAVLFLWTTSPKLEEAMQVIAAWGFTYRTSMVWIKDKIGMGYYARSRHELLLIATRGSIPVPETRARFDSVLIAPRQEHSAKPAEMYSRIESM
jgi:N6-adenosine-specific RNA methylase IME4